MYLEKHLYDLTTERRLNAYVLCDLQYSKLWHKLVITFVSFDRVVTSRKEVDMTENQLKYWDLQELKRHNLRTEELDQYRTDKQFEGTKYSADKNYEGVVYSANKNYEGVKYSADRHYAAAIGSARIHAGATVAAARIGAGAAVASARISANAAISSAQIGAASNMFNSQRMAAAQQYSADRHYQAQVTTTRMNNAQSWKNTRDTNNASNFNALIGAFGKVGAAAVGSSMRRGR